MGFWARLARAKRVWPGWVGVNLHCAILASWREDRSADIVRHCAFVARRGMALREKAGLSGLLAAASCGIASSQAKARGESRHPPYGRRPVPLLIFPPGPPFKGCQPQCRRPRARLAWAYGHLLESKTQALQRGLGFLGWATCSTPPPSWSKPVNPCFISFDERIFHNAF